MPTRVTYTFCTPTNLTEGRALNFSHCGEKSPEAVRPECYAGQRLNEQRQHMNSALEEIPFAESDRDKAHQKDNDQHRLVSASCMLIEYFFCLLEVRKANSDSNPNLSSHSRKG